MVIEMRRGFGSALMIAAASGLLTLALPNIAMAQSKAKTDFYTLCALHPEAAVCPKIFRQAMHQSGPGVLAVQKAYQSYARYLENPHGGLTAADRRYLRMNNIVVPNWLSPAQMAGLHNVINDPTYAKKAQARQAAVNNFIGRAVQSGLYCDFNTCGKKSADMLLS